MSIIDYEGSSLSSFKIVLFSIVAVIFAYAAFIVVKLTQTRKHYNGVLTVRYLFPLILLFCVIENVVIIVKGPKGFLQFIFVLQALQVPVFLVVIFELTYLVHKRRSVNFCGMSFDEGRLGQRIHGVFTTSMQSFLLRNVMRILSTLCLVMGLMANFDLMRDEAKRDPLAGRVGWWAVFDQRDYVLSFHIVLSLIPTLVLIICSLFLSVSLWRYGNNSAMVVHSRLINSWYFPMFGTVLLSLGQMFSDDWYPFMSNFGLLLYTGALIFLMKEIDKDIISTAEFTRFLKLVSEKGNQYSVFNRMKVVENNQNQDFDNQKVVTDDADTM